MLSALCCASGIAEQLKPKSEGQKEGHDCESNKYLQQEKLQGKEKELLGKVAAQLFICFNSEGGESLECYGFFFK